MTKRLLLPRSQAVGLDGRPLAGAKLYTYATGTATPKPVFTDAALSVPHANPVVADAAGRWPAMFLGAGDYRTVLEDAAGVVIATDDPVEGDDAAAAGDIALAGLAARRNRIVNPAMQISQERGTAFVDCTTGGTYAIDQWVAGLATTPGGTLRVQQVASPTPGGSPWRLRMTAQVADTSIAAGDAYNIVTPIEGLMIADARFGSSAARQLLLRFGVRSSVAGTFGVAVRNSAGNRAWIGTITIAAGEVNTDLVRTLTIPGDTTGTWLTDTGAGLFLRITLAAGTTFHGTAGWQSADVLTTAAQTNFMSTASATFELFDVGLYVDTLGAGVFPPFEVPDFGEELRRCQRYWAPLRMESVFVAAAGGHFLGHHFPFPVQMRTTPVLATNADGALTNASAADFDTPSIAGCRAVVTSAGAGASAAAGRTGSANARL